MGYSAALAIDHAGSECFVCREQPASPYEHKPPRPHVAPPAGTPRAGTPHAGTRPASPRRVIVTTPVVEREVRVADGKLILGTGVMTGVTWTNEIPRMNFEVELEAMRVDGSDFFCALTFPVNSQSPLSPIFTDFFHTRASVF